MVSVRQRLVTKCTKPWSTLPVFTEKAPQDLSRTSGINVDFSVYGYYKSTTATQTYIMKHGLTYLWIIVISDLDNLFYPFCEVTCEVCAQKKTKHFNLKIIINFIFKTSNKVIFHALNFYSIYLSK